VIYTPRARRIALAWALLCAGLFTGLAVAIASEWAPLLDTDHDLARRPFELTSDHAWLRHVADVVATATQPNYVVLVGLAAAIALTIKGYRRAGIFTAVVLVLARLVYWGLKELLGRPRPHWNEPIDRPVGWSFPSATPRRSRIPCRGCPSRCTRRRRPCAG